MDRWICLGVFAFSFLVLVLKALTHLLNLSTPVEHPSLDRIGVLECENLAIASGGRGR